MKICFMCDLHLQKDADTIQYRAFEYALAETEKRGADAVIFAGDFTSDGDMGVYMSAVERFTSISAPTIFIPGNSDLRCDTAKEKIHAITSPVYTKIGDTGIFAVNDADGKVSEDTISSLENAKAGDIVFMHHPLFGLSEPSRTAMKNWRCAHPDVYLFYAHIHKYERLGNDFSLPALDPDKAIGESPSVMFFDTENGNVEKLYYHCPVPNDIYDYFGITAYRAEEHVSYAAKKGLKYLELRPGAADINRDTLTDLIAEWRRCGGEHLSIHLPDITYIDGEAKLTNSHYKLIELAETLGADRFTQHVPKVRVCDARADSECLPKMAKALSDALNVLTHKVTVGIENMHMTSSDNADDTRRYGYLPCECLEFMNLLAKYTRHKVGINLDVGHARNNPPYSENYQVSGWYSAVGKYCVGYHVHQVSVDQSFKKHNHTAITDVYGHLISYASFFRTWSEGQLAHAPVIFEMDAPDAYDITLDTFEKTRIKLKT